MLRRSIELHSVENLVHKVTDGLQTVNVIT
jgi:hypothetical protein